jgi:hypothetical protein
VAGRRDAPRASGGGHDRARVAIEPQHLADLRLAYADAGSSVPVGSWRTSMMREPRRRRRWAVFGIGGCIDAWPRACEWRRPWLVGVSPRM